VLLSWRNSLRVGLCPDRLILARVKRGVGKRAADKRIMPFKATAEPQFWSGLLAALRQVLKAYPSAQLTVIVSNHFVRYLLVPWSAELKSEEEWRAFVQHYYRRVFGPAADNWACRWQSQGEGRPVISAAVEQPLLDALEAVVQENGGRLVSVQPHLMWAFNRQRHALSLPSLWWVLAEPGQVSLSLLHQGVWHSLRTWPADQTWAEQLPLWLERERVLAPDGGSEVLVQAIDRSDAALPRGHGLSFRWIDSDTGPGDAAYAMVS
jgi:hypothetical protein